MKISVVIPTHNRPDNLRRAINSVLHQSRPADEIIVVDDGSDIPAVVPEGVTLLRHDESKGGSAARNTGIRAAASDYIAFLDDDDECLPTRLKRIAEASADVIHHPARIVYTNEGVEYDSRPSHNITVDRLLTANLIGTTSVVCVNRDLALAVGGFDETLPALQDWEMWIRLAKGGASFFCLDTPLTRYHFATGERAMSKSIDNMNEAVRLIIAKHQADFHHLNPAQKRALAATTAGWKAHRHNMRGARLNAAWAYLTGALKSRKPSLLAQAALSIGGVRSLALARKLVK